MPGHNPDNLSCSNLGLRGDAHIQFVNRADPECSPVRVAPPLVTWELSRLVVSAAAVLTDRGQVLLALMLHRGWVFPGGKVASLHGVYDLIGDKDAYGVPIDPYHKVVTTWRCVLDPRSERDPTVQLSELIEARWFDYGEVCFLRDHGHLSLVGADIFRDPENFS